MEVNKDHLDSIYEVLADKIRSEEIVTSYMLKFPTDTRFSYKGDKQTFSTIYYQLHNQDKAVKVIELSDMSTDSGFVDQVLRDVKFLFEKAKEHRRILDFYLEKINNL